MQNTGDTPDLAALTATLHHLTDTLVGAAGTDHDSVDMSDADAGQREGAAIHAAGAILTATDRLMAAVVGLLAQTTHRGVIADQGVTTSTWLRVFAARTVGDEKMLTATVDRLADMPAVTAWFTEDTLSWPTVRGIIAATRNLTSDRRRWLDDTLAADRHRLLRLDADQIVANADRLADQARPDLHADREQRQFHGQRFSVQPRFDGSSHVTAEFDAEATATLLAGLDSSTADDRSDDETVQRDGSAGGDGGSDTDWRHRRARSNADRLIAIITGHLAGRPGGRARPPCSSSPTPPPSPAPGHRGHRGHRQPTGHT